MVISADERNAISPFFISFLVHLQLFNCRWTASSLLVCDGVRSMKKCALINSADERNVISHFFLFHISSKTFLSVEERQALRYFLKMFDER